MASVLLARGPAAWRIAALVLLVALAAIGAGAALRSTEYDESYTRLVTSPEPRPDWPAGPFTPAEAAPVLEAVAAPGAISDNLRGTDVHPPLYFWLAGAWRMAGGTSVGALRALSVVLALGAVAAVMAAAGAAGLPPLATGLGTALAYGFAYTGGVARGFALAHLLLGLGLLGVVLAWRHAAEAGRAGGGRAGGIPGTGLAALGGLAAGAASFANYLAAFPAAAIVGWLLIAPLPWPARLRLLAAAALPFLLVQGGNLHFFLAQHDARPGQFEAFAPLAALRLLGQFNAANLFGGLPLYLDGAGRAAVAALLVGLFLAGAAAVALRWRAIGPTRWLWLGGFVAPSAGLLLLGAAFGTTPVELRYLSFAAPFAAGLLAGAAAGWTARAPRLAQAALGVVLLVQAAGIAGMALHPATRQPYRDALAALAPVLGPQTLLLLPHSNDGVGIVGAVLAEAPRDQPVLALREANIPTLHAQAAPYARLVLLGIADRAGAPQVEAARAALAADPDWVEQGTAWRDVRRGHAATVYVPAEGPAARVSRGRSDARIAREGFDARVAREGSAARIAREGSPARIARSRMADRAEGVVVGRADHRREEPERIRPATVGQGAALHLLGEQLRVLGKGFRGPAQRFPRQDELQLLG